MTDFISRKTAVFGMTRVGKSNTNKTIATAVFEHAARTDKPIGQLIFDPQGEYARINQQDKTGLRLLGLGTDLVKIYTMRPDPDSARNILSASTSTTRGQLPLVWELIIDGSRRRKHVATRMPSSPQRSSILNAAISRQAGGRTTNTGER